jgi:hypothetical protein
MTDESTEGEETPRCGYPETTTGDPCRRRVTNPEKRCYLHRDDGETPDGHGAPPGNTNAVRHGLYMSVEKRIDWFSEEQQTWFREYAETYRRKAENDGEVARLASLAVITDVLIRDLLKNGVVRSDADGDRVRGATVGALLAAKGELRRGLRTEGVTEDRSGL